MERLFNGPSLHLALDKINPSKWDVILRKNTAHIGQNYEVAGRSQIGANLEYLPWYTMYLYVTDNTICQRTCKDL